VSKITGNLLGAFVVVHIETSTFFILLTGLTLLGAIFFLFLRKPTLQVKVEEPIGVVKIKETTSLIRQTFDLLKSKRMLKCTPIMIYSSITQSIYAGIMIPIIIQSMGKTDFDPAEKTRYALFAMIFLGIGEIAGSLFNGQF
jgi:hypothetical protein